MHSALQHLDHRPWPLPRSPWVMRQSWHDLLFAHWPVPAKELRPLVPSSVEVEEFDGTSWVGVVPFRMSGVTARGVPDLPWISAFPELNLRLYVTAGGKPGVWFISLDAANPLAVWTARRFFHLPYFHADMKLEQEGERVRYRSARRGAAVHFRGDYWPTGGVYRSKPGTLEHFLTERYCLYTESRTAALLRAEVHHPRWPLQPAAAEIAENTIASAQGITLPAVAPLLHFSRRLDVVVWPPRALRKPGSMKGRIRMAPDFDATPEDFKDYL